MTDYLNGRITYRKKGRPMKGGNRNPNTRAIVSALQCDHRILRRAAAQLVDKVTKGNVTPRTAVMLAFDAYPRTAETILRLRALVTKTGAWKP